MFDGFFPISVLISCIGQGRGICVRPLSLRGQILEFTFDDVVPTGGMPPSGIVVIKDARRVPAIPIVEGDIILYEDNTR